MTDLRRFEQTLSADTRIYVEYRNYPIFEYAVMLQIKTLEDRWQTIRLFDNAHGTNEMHRYTGARKRLAEPFMEDRASNEAMPRAIAYLEDNCQEVRQAWRNEA